MQPNKLSILHRPVKGSSGASVESADAQWDKEQEYWRLKAQKSAATHDRLHRSIYPSAEDKAAAYAAQKEHQELNMHAKMLERQQHEAEEAKWSQPGGYAASSALLGAGAGGADGGRVLPQAGALYMTPEQEKAARRRAEEEAAAVNQRLMAERALREREQQEREVEGTRQMLADQSFWNSTGGDDRYGGHRRGAGASRPVSAAPVGGTIWAPDYPIEPVPAQPPKQHTITPPYCLHDAAAPAQAAASRAYGQYAGAEGAVPPSPAGSAASYAAPAGYAPYAASTAPAAGSVTARVMDAARPASAMTRPAPFACDDQDSSAYAQQQRPMSSQRFAARPAEKRGVPWATDADLPASAAPVSAATSRRVTVADAQSRVAEENAAWQQGRDRQGDVPAAGYVKPQQQALTLQQYQQPAEGVHHGKAQGAFAPKTQDRSFPWSWEAK